MKHILFTLLGLIALTIPISAQAVEIGAPAPAIETTDINGNPFKLSDHKGKILVLEWTNNKCPFVIKHYDSGNMQKTQKQARAMENVEWVSIISSAPGKQGNVTPQQAKEIIEQVGASPTTQLLDPEGTIGKTYNAKTTPHMFIIDEQGNIAYAGAIDDNSSPRQSVIPDSKNYVLAALNEIKAGTPVTTASTQPYGCSIKY